MSFEGDKASGHEQLSKTNLERTFFLYFQSLFEMNISDQPALSQRLRVELVNAGHLAACESPLNAIHLVIAEHPTTQRQLGDASTGRLREL